MSKTTTGRMICPGLWQLKTATFRVRVQKVDPRTGRKFNRTRKLEGVTRAQALQVLESLRDELEQRCDAPAAVAITAQETLGAFAKSWLTIKLGRDDLAPSTAIRYGNALDRLSPWLREMPLADVAPRDVEQWMIASKKQGFAASTINSWLRVLRAALTDAARDRLVVVNVAQQVRALAEPVDLEDTNSLSQTELVSLLRAMRTQNPTVHAAAWTQALTGLRWGETSALKWEDHDEERHVLKIRRSVCERKLRPLTKTRRARIVGVPEVLARILRKHRETMIEQQHPGLSSGLMFPSKVGTPLANSRICDALKVACTDAGIRRRFTSHGFRRTMTDLLRLAEVDPVVAAGLTGHETERMRRHYSTVRTKEAVDASERVAMLLQPSAESLKESPGESAEPEHENGPSHAGV